MMQHIHNLDNIRKAATAQKQIAVQNQLALQAKLTRSQRHSAKIPATELREEAALRLLTVHNRQGMDAHLLWIRICEDARRREIENNMQGDARLYALAHLNGAVAASLIAAVSLELHWIRHRAFIGIPPSIEQTQPTGA